MFKFFRNIYWNIRRAIILNYFFNRRVINPLTYDDALNHWVKTPKRFQINARGVRDSWWSAETDLLNWLELKLNYIFYRLKHDGNHAFWYLDMTPQVLDLCNENDLKLLIVSELKKRFLSGKNKHKWEQELFLKRDEQVQKLAFVKAKTGYKVSFRFYNINTRKVKKPRRYYTIDTEACAKTDAQIKSLTKALKTLLQSPSNSEDDVKAIKEQIKTLREQRLKEVYKYIDTEEYFTLDKEVFFTEITDPITDDKVVNMLEYVNQLKVYDLLNSMLSVDLDPQLYSKLSESVRLKARGRRKDLIHLLKARRHLKNLIKHVDYDFYDDFEIDKDNPQKSLEDHKQKKVEARKEFYHKFIDYVAENFDEVWD